MIENSMFEEEPDVVDLAKEPPLYPLEPDDAVYEPRSSRLLVRGLGENELDEEEEDCESSARLLGMSFMNRTSSLRNNNSSYIRQESNGSCSFPSARTLFVGAFVLLVIATVAMVIYFLPKCNFTKEGCNKTDHSVEPLYPISTNGKIFPWTNIRLPRNVIPVHYDISLHPDLITMTFNGSVTIKMKIIEETRNIILHSSGLSLNVKSSMVEGTHRKISEMLEYKPWDQIALVFPEDLQKGQTCIVEIEFSANLSDTYSGFYKSSYKNKDGEIRWLAATQFEPLAARTAFPCFDEPDFKATFLIKIKRDANYISLSNMPKIHSTELHDDIVEDEFEKSVNMSTYLVAFIVADFKSVSKELNGTKWFGNLVTMEWWSDLWLNEGFATFMEFMSVQSTFPELEVNDDFLMARFRAMAKDSLNSSHPISSSVSTPEEIEEIFDSVSYEKLKILSLFGNLIDKQTWANNGSLADHRLRSSLLKIACTYQHQSCLEKARSLFSTWKTSRNNISLPADVKSTVFFVGAMSEEGWNILLQEYSESMYDAEKHKILEALASTPNTTKLVWMMQDSLNGGIFRPLDLPTILSAASKTLSGYLYAWDFVKEKWDLIIEK
ncbi:LCAP aminopeptidase, partial [Polypterus senegalus]